jgi:hypothetical protein
MKIRKQIHAAEIVIITIMGIRMAECLKMRQYKDRTVSFEKPSDIPYECEPAKESFRDISRM